MKGELSYCGKDGEGGIKVTLLTNITYSFRGLPDMKGELSFCEKDGEGGSK